MSGTLTEWLNRGSDFGEKRRARAKGGYANVNIADLAIYLVVMSPQYVKLALFMGTHLETTQLAFLHARTVSANAASFQET